MPHFLTPDAYVSQTFFSPWVKDVSKMPNEFHENHLLLGMLVAMHLLVILATFVNYGSYILWSIFLEKS